MKKLLLVGLLALAMAVAAFADIPNRDKTAVQEAITPHGGGGATGACSIVYYNLCSRWLWVWSGWSPGDEIGVVFDLPLDCGKLPGEECLNTGFWWYWRYTTPGWGYTVHYDVYDIDAAYCKIGGSLGTSASQDPVERWNFHPALGTAITSDLGGILATWDKGGLPYAGTDNNYKNAAAPGLCPGYAPGPIRSFIWLPAAVCPTYYFGDGMGPVQLLMDAGFDCQPTATEDASWTGVKSLFR
ncbi:MAG: hypothetical protein FJY73_08730 [Candidatus Eisenbacteria bacterium]|nr:hypothetical protein [Candidatus Eisenbacteria bacterium]